MKNEKKLLLLVLISIFLTSFLLQSFVVLISKESENPGIPKAGIELEPVYGVEYLHIEIPSVLISSSMCSVNISVKNTGKGTWNKDGKEPVCRSYH